MNKCWGFKEKDKMVIYQSPCITVRNHTPASTLVENRIVVFSNPSKNTQKQHLRQPPCITVRHHTPASTLAENRIVVISNPSKTHKKQHLRQTYSLDRCHIGKAYYQYAHMCILHVSFFQYYTTSGQKIETNYVSICVVD